MSNIYYRSKLEHTFASTYPSLKYEVEKIPYVIPASKHKYTPDFQVSRSMYLETKGVLKAADRKKLLLVKEANPHTEIIMVFQNPELKATSRQTYWQWAEKNGFRWFKWDDPAIQRIIDEEQSK